MPNVSRIQRNDISSDLDEIAREGICAASRTATTSTSGPMASTAASGWKRIASAHW